MRKKAFRQPGADTQAKACATFYINNLAGLGGTGFSLCELFVAWRQNISSAPVAANSAAIIAKIAANTLLTPNWYADNPAYGLRRGRFAGPAGAGTAGGSVIFLDGGVLITEFSF